MNKKKRVTGYGAMAIAAAAALSVVAGCGGGGGSTVLAPPAVLSAAVNPTLLPSTGGGVTISSQVAGDGISQVRATVVRPDSSTATVTLSGSSGSYSGVYSAPANTTDSVRTYTVTVRATNTNGAYDDSEATAFGVLPAEAPPIPPPPGP